MEEVHSSIGNLNSQNSTEEVLFNEGIMGSHRPSCSGLDDTVSVDMLPFVFLKGVGRMSFTSPEESNSCLLTPRF